jgi:3-oxoacyl-[acyl-carrier protein] reductase
LTQAENPKPVAVITGGCRGIGRGIAKELSRSHNVVATYRERLDAAESLRAKTGVEIFRCDISSAADRTALLDFTRERFGRLDLLINSAGIAPRVRRDILEATEEGYDEVMATNLKGPYFLTQQAARWMVEQKDGRIVFITSISSYTASLNRGEYCISKAGVTMAVALYALRLAADNIKVFEIRPGLIDTDIIAPARKMYEERIAHGLFPQGRIGQPSDVARVVRAIADGLMDYSTGQVLNVDGGWSLRLL